MVLIMLYWHHITTSDTIVQEQIYFTTPIYDTWDPDEGMWDKPDRYLQKYPSGLRQRQPPIRRYSTTLPSSLSPVDLHPDDWKSVVGSRWNVKDRVSENQRGRSKSFGDYSRAKTSERTCLRLGKVEHGEEELTKKSEIWSETTRRRFNCTH